MVQLLSTHQYQILINLFCLEVAGYCEVNHAGFVDSFQIILSGTSSQIVMHLFPLYGKATFDNILSVFYSDTNL